MTTSVRIGLQPRICQGDIFKDVEMIEYAIEKAGTLEVSKIVFPLVVVLTQDCDLEQEHRFRWGHREVSTQDKWLISILVAPLYNIEHVYKGEHLTKIGMTMQTIKETKTPGKFLRNNERPRYHFLSFPETLHIADSVADFKHYFSVNGQYLRALRRSSFVARLAPLHREDLSQRFSSYLARIGLPD